MELINKTLVLKRVKIGKLNFNHSVTGAVWRNNIIISLESF